MAPTNPTSSPSPSATRHPTFHAEQFPWHEVYPFAGTVSAVSACVLWDWLGWVPPVAAHQIVVPLFAALIWFLGWQLGLATVALLVVSPRFLSIHTR